MPKNTERNSRHLATFDVEKDKRLLGELHIKGRNTSLRLLHSEPVPPLDGVDVLHGELQDLRKVTCLQCMPSSSGCVSIRDNRESHYADVFPHFVTIGEQHLFPEHQCIEGVYFTIDDISSIFYDFNAFGTIIDSKPLIEAVASGKKEKNKVPIGEMPVVAYFGGQCEIFSSSTQLGIFRVSHVPSWRSGGPKGVFIKNHMRITLEPAQPIDFDDCISRLMVFLRFLSALAGRAQVPRGIHLKLSGRSNELSSSSLRLHWSYRPQGNKERQDISNDTTQPGDVPLDAIRRPDEFSVVLKHWVIRDETWQSARVRYAGCMRKGNSYSANRLVAAANMFDLLPEDAVPLPHKMSVELETAKNDCLKIFTGLKISIERDSVIAALKRMDKPSLPKKILHRVSIVDEQMGSVFPELALVVKTAVKVRNHFVHGGSDSFDFKAVDDFTPFFTDALEFVFLASDLIEAGWDAKFWSKGAYGWGHSFARFRWHYVQTLNDLKQAINASANK